MFKENGEKKVNALLVNSRRSLYLSLRYFGSMPSISMWDWIATKEPLHDHTLSAPLE